MIRKLNSLAFVLFALVLASIGLASPPVEKVQSVTLAKSSVFGRTSVSVVVNLYDPAPIGGVLVNLACGDHSSTSSPTLNFSRGSRSAKFVVSTIAVAADVTDAIKASCAAISDSSPSASLTILAPTVTGLTLSPTSVVGGKLSTATVKLASPAPAGFSVSLGSDHPSFASVPDSVGVSEGKLSATFSVTTAAVSGASSAVISATSNSSSATANLNVTAAQISSFTVTSSVVGGSGVKASVTLAGKAPADEAVVVSISSSNSAISGDSITIPAGSTSGSKTISSVPVDHNTTVQLTAGLNGQTVSKNVSVTAPTVRRVALASKSVVFGGTVSGVVTLSSPAPAGYEVMLSSDKAVAWVPTSISFAAGDSTATFSVTTAFAATTQTATISAVANSMSQTANLTVTSAMVSSLSVKPAYGGIDADATVTLNGTAPDGGVTVTLTTGDGSVASPSATVTVPAGSNSLSFAIPTSPVGSDVFVDIAASVGAQSPIVRSLRVISARPKTITFSSSSVLGGFANPTMTIILTSPAPAGGLDVYLSSSNDSVASVPYDVYVDEGATSVQVDVQTYDPDADSVVTMRAEVGSTHIKADLNVTRSTGYGLSASYYNNKDLSGAPVLTRTDRTVDFRWGGGSPDPSVHNDHFSARWTGQIQAIRGAGTYTIETITDDGVRVWIDGNLIIDNWTDHGDQVNSFDLDFDANSSHSIVIEYYENGGGATMQLHWIDPNYNLEAVPIGALTPS